MREKSERGAGFIEPLKLPDNVGATVHDLLRYGFTGLAVFAAFLYLDHDIGDIPKGLADMGRGVFAAVPCGAIAYIASRTLLVPIVVVTFEYAYALVDAVRRLCLRLDKSASNLNLASWLSRLKWVLRAAPWLATRGIFFVRSTDRARTRFMYFRQRYGLSFVESELAYQILREAGRRRVRGVYEAEGLWPNSVKTQLYRQHSELHMVYATALAVLGAAVYAGVNCRFSKCDALLCVGAVLCTIAGIADILVSRRECAAIQNAENEEPGSVKAILEQHGLKLAIRPESGAGE